MDLHRGYGLRSPPYTEWGCAKATPGGDAEPRVARVWVCLALLAGGGCGQGKRRDIRTNGGGEGRAARAEGYRGDPADYVEERCTQFGERGM